MFELGLGAAADPAAARTAIRHGLYSQTQGRHPAKALVANEDSHQDQYYEHVAQDPKRFVHRPEPQGTFDE